MIKGEQVVCIRTIKDVGITKGFIYTPIKDGILIDNAILIKNDFGDQLWYTIKDNFITLSEFRKNRINEILDETN